MACLFFCVLLLYFGVLTNLFLAGKDEVKPDVVWKYLDVANNEWIVCFG